MQFEVMSYDDNEGDTATTNQPTANTAGREIVSTPKELLESNPAPIDPNTNPNPTDPIIHMTTVSEPVKESVKEPVKTTEQEPSTTTNQEVDPRTLNKPYECKMCHWLSRGIEAGFILVLIAMAYHLYKRAGIPPVA